MYVASVGLRLSHSSAGVYGPVSMIKKRKRDFKNILAKTNGTRVDTSPRYFSSIDIKYFIYSDDLTNNEAERYISLSLEKSFEEFDLLISAGKLELKSGK